MLNLMQRNKLVRAINKHIKEQVNLSWMGSQHPDDWETIKYKAKTAQVKLNKLLNSLTVENGQ